MPLLFVLFSQQYQKQQYFLRHPIQTHKSSGMLEAPEAKVLTQPISYRNRTLQMNMKKVKIQTRFFLSYLSLVLIVEIIFSIFFYRYASAILIERETQNIIDLTASYQSQTDQALKVMDNLSINVGYSNLIKEGVAEHFTALESDPQNINSLAGLFIAINGTDSQVDQINIYDFSGAVIGFGRLALDTHIDLSAQSWYEPTLAESGHKYLPMPYYTPAFSGSLKTRKPYFSLFRTYFNKYGREVGIVETVQDYHVIFKSIINQTKNKKQAPEVYIYNNYNQLVYPFSDSSAPVPKLEDTPFSDQLKDNFGQTSIRSGENGSKKLLAYQRSSYSGWLFITLQPEENVLLPVKNLTLILALVALATLLGAGVLAYYAARSLSRPIKRLRKVIHSTELSTLGHPKNSQFFTSIEEIDQLHQAFQQMGSDLKNSMEDLITTKQQEIKSRSLALQSQINPHFYYNSLSSIIILAENNRSEEVVTLCRNLSQIMRYITKNSSTKVCLREEVDYVSKYLYCMKVRYQSSLSYEINLPQELLDLEIPKLIIQPLVENAIKYGTDCAPPWNISIRGQIETTHWQIEVLDSGHGFSNASLAKIQERIDQTTCIGLPDLAIDGMGLVNVYCRWKLETGDACIFSCQNPPAGGALVTLGRFTQIDQ